MSTTYLDHLPPLPKDKSVRIGCIGSGFIMADCHLVAYRQAGLNPVAIASRTPANAKVVAQRHAIARVYDDYQRLLEDDSIEVVDIAVPPDVQSSVIEDVVKRTDHVRGILAQKPLGVDYAQAKRIVSLCRDAGVTLA